MIKATSNLLGVGNTRPGACHSDPSRRGISPEVEQPYSRPGVSVKTGHQHTARTSESRREAKRYRSKQCDVSARRTDRL